MITLKKDAGRLTGHRKAVARLAFSLLAAACLSSAGVLAEPPGTMDEFDELPMNMNNPGSIVERLEEDAEPKDYLFQFPGVTGALTL